MVPEAREAHLMCRRRLAGIARSVGSQAGRFGGRLLKYLEDSADRETEGIVAIVQHGREDSVFFLSRFGTKIARYCVDMIRRRKENGVLALSSKSHTGVRAAALPDFSSVLGEMPVHVYDFELLGVDECRRKLVAATEPCRMVFWYPQNLHPSQVLTLQRELVENGATLARKQEASETAAASWESYKPRMEAVLRDSHQAVAASHV